MDVEVRGQGVCADDMKGGCRGQPVYLYLSREHNTDPCACLSVCLSVCVFVCLFASAYVLHYSTCLHDKYNVISLHQRVLLLRVQKLNLVKTNKK